MRLTAPDHTAYRRKRVRLDEPVYDLAGLFDHVLGNGEPDYLERYRAETVETLDEVVIPRDSETDRYEARSVSEKAFWRPASFDAVFPTGEADEFYLRYRQRDEEAVDAVLWNLAATGELAIAETSYHSHIVIEE